MLRPDNFWKTSNGNTTFEWSEVARFGSVIYALEIAKDPGFGSDSAIQFETTERTFRIPDDDELSKGDYFWRVRAFVNDAAGATSEVRTLTITKRIVEPRPTITPPPPATPTPANDAPTLEVEIPDQIMVEDAPDLILDLSGVFGDVDIVDGDSLTLSVFDNTNPGLVTANLNGTTLTLSLLTDQIGVADITIRATDLASEHVDDIFQLTVDPPTVRNAVINFEGLIEGSIVGSVSSGAGISGDPIDGAVLILHALCAAI